MQVLPLLRRTFANFSHPERRKLGEKVRTGGANGLQSQAMLTGFDADRAMQGLPVMLELLGLTVNNIQ
jgi:hypothetical protein